MRSSLVPDQKCSECGRVHCAVFRHSASTVYHSTCNLPSCQGRAFHWLGEKVPESARKWGRPSFLVEYLFLNCCVMFQLLSWNDNWPIYLLTLPDNMERNNNAELPFSACHLLVRERRTLVVCITWFRGPCYITLIYWALSLIMSIVRSLGVTNWVTRCSTICKPIFHSASDVGY